MPLAARTVGSKIVLGAHISAAGGVHNAVTASVHIGGNAFALFLKSQRKWVNPDLQDEHCTQFLSNCKEHKYDKVNHKIPPIVPHGSYLVNLAHPDPDRTKQAYDVFLDDLDRCNKLGIHLYNFHPGNAAANESREDAIEHLAGQLNRAHKDPSSGSVVTLLETMAAGGNVLGSTFQDLASIIDLIQQKDRVGVCLDTCHVFAAGYDLRAPEVFKATIDDFDSIIGLKYLKALHINDSKAPIGSQRDLHANIGTGFLGLRSFHNIVNESRLWGLPMILETPIDVKDPETKKEVPDKSIWAREIKLLESLVGMDVESAEFKRMQVELQEKGLAERERVQDQVDRREEKKKARSTKGAKRRKGKKEESSDGESSSAE
ncbi:DNA-lyase [Tothia fuscella]|uniref:Apurinic-apyrimidinic endonuclease 1 n=1 Tax=Tothia fuscella TaxID=1048955 RepID=A0A9P4TU38_9PEZI|nr:DNA-lyase [Tothia fuscella]